MDNSYTDLLEPCRDAYRLRMALFAIKQQPRESRLSTLHAALGNDQLLARAARGLPLIEQLRLSVELLNDRAPQHVTVAKPRVACRAWPPRRPRR